MQVNDKGATPASAARRAQIVQSAIRVLAEHGYGNTSFTRIADHAGLSSTRLISYHFAGKTDLMRAVVDTVTTTATEHLRPRLDAAADKPTALTAFIRWNLEFIATHPDHIRALIEIVTGSRGAEGRSVTDDSVAVMKTFFAEGQAAGDFRAFDPHVMAVSLRVAIDAAADDPDIDHAAYAEELVAIFTRATRRETT